METQAVHQFFFQLMVILLTARLFGELFARLQSPAVVGELLAGVILGPSLLAWLEPSQVIKLLAEIGIILLLFEVGLDTDIRQLAKTGLKALFVAVSGFVWPFALGFSISHFLFGRSLLESLFIGGTLTATSIGITVRVLTDLKRHHSHEAQVVLGAAVIDDILGVVLLAVLYDFSKVGQIDPSNAVRVIGFIAMFFVLAPLFAKVISLMIRKFAKISQTEGLIPTLIVSLVLYFAWLAHEMGAPELLGGFAAGLALSRRFFLPFGLALHEDSDFTGRIEAQMLPIVQLFVPIFFVTVGLSLNLRAIDWTSPFIWGFSASLFAVAVLGKLLGALLLHDPWKERLAIGIAMIPRGEVGLIFAELGRTSGILNNEIYAALIIVIAMTTLLAPILLKGYYRCLHIV
ncbi:cation:proton antiporter [Methylomonas koyamae]|uniref:Sodium:proton antiporter n=1 Tax=Methylomonas koyamae TaxID=702114 RepID=A0A177NK50_9GAMM|nr:cation:proton antiporter [Methylomonas koyamae]OAI17569.1 sodium:proton antiporter [Methylomonas koyamae]